MEKNLFRKATVLFILAVLLIPFHCLSQQAVVSSGGDAEGSGGSVSYTIGQIFYQTHGAEYTLSEGVQQPIEISVVNVVTPDPGISLRAYPNPARDHLMLETEQLVSEKMEYRFFDSHGRLVENRKITDQKTRISLSHLEAGVYFLHVFQTNDPLNQQASRVREMITFKIIKY